MNHKVIYRQDIHNLIAKFLENTVATLESGNKERNNAGAEHTRMYAVRSVNRLLLSVTLQSFHNLLQFFHNALQRLSERSLNDLYVGSTFYISTVFNKK